MLDDEIDSTPSLRRRRRWVGVRLVLAVAAGVAVFGVFLLVAYEEAIARIPEHRAALERLVRAQTGLDVRFNELGVRWGWYGPEAVFRRVELDEPGTSRVLLRAPELVVGFDAWRTLRSGHPEAGRIELVAADIDFAGLEPGVTPHTAPKPSLHPGFGNAHPATDTRFDRMAILQRWRGVRIDLDGGTLRLPDPGGSATPFTLQIRRASLRRSDEEWSAYGLVFLPDRIGRMARVVMRVTGDLNQPGTLSGSVRLEAHRLLFSGCRDLLAPMTGLAAYLPRAGSGDLTTDVDFAGGSVIKATGNLRAAGLVFAGLQSKASRRQEAHEEASGDVDELTLERLRGDFRLARSASEWRLRVDSLEAGRSRRQASLRLDAARSGEWIRGTLEGAALKPIVAVARWMRLPMDLAGIRLNGLVREVGFDWSELRPEGDKLQLSARMQDITLMPRSGDFSLSGFDLQLQGSESLQTAELRSRSAHLELAQSRQYPLSDIHLAARLRIARVASGWQLTTDAFTLEHERVRLTVAGTLRQDAAHAKPTISARGTLAGADIPLLKQLLGDSSAQAFGAVASRLTAGRIRNAEFALHGPVAELPFGGHADAFTGSLSLQEAILSGGDLWPDAEAVDARVAWSGAKIQAIISGGHAGAFQLTGARAEWDAAGRSATRLSGRITGRLEEAIAWMEEHPGLQSFAPQVQDIPASGAATFDFRVSVPPDAEGAPLPSSAAALQTSRIQARVTTSLRGARLQAVAGLPPMEALTGSFVFDGGHLQRSSLSGMWFGGPVTLRLGEHMQAGVQVFAIQAQGVLSAQQLANAANAPATAQGNADWNGELEYVTASTSRPSSWRMHAESNLLGVLSTLPAPFAKKPALALPAHVEITGAADSAELHASLGDRLRSSLELRKRPEGWRVSRGAVRFDSTPPSLPVAPIVLVQGRLSRLDLPDYVAAWQQLRWDNLPRVHVQIVAADMLLGGEVYPDVSLQADGTQAGTQLQLQSADLEGEASWPTRGASAHQAGADGSPGAAEIHLTRLTLAHGVGPGEEVAMLAALAPLTRVSVDVLLWQGRSLGRLSATLATHGNSVAAEDLLLANDSHTAHGALHCQAELVRCRLSFSLASTDVATTLKDFGFRSDLSAAQASLGGEVEWPLAGKQPWLARLEGTVRLRLADGLTHNPKPDDPGTPFALFSVPALLHGLDAAEAARAALPQPLRELHFARLDADFQLRGGEAQTSDLHFDGDAEILMRGHTGLLARDFDQQVWILRGEERLPAAIRRFGATPRVAAAWLSLRELFEGSGQADRSGAELRLQGSWDDPMVVAAD